MEFSEVYEPLFELLEARRIVNSDSFTEDYTYKEQKYWLELSIIDTVLISGGRDSGKSYALSCFNTIAPVDYDHRILYTRQTMSSTDNSITEALESRMELMGYASKYSAANKIYSVKDGVGKISITGQKTSVGTQTAKLKSLEDFSIFETDEGEELESYDNWNKVKRSMRAKDVQTLSIIVFNPPTTDHWMYNQWYSSVPEGFCGVVGNVLYIHSTYLDNGKENMTEANWNEYEALRINYELYNNTPKDKRDSLPSKVKRDYKEYKYAILGGFKNKAEGVVFDDWSKGEFNPDNLQVSYGQDYGFSNDPTTLAAVAIDKKKKKIYIKEYLYKPRLKTSQIADVNNLHAKGKMIIGDSAEPRLINELRGHGCNMIEAKKPKGSITAGVMMMQDYELVVDPSSENMITELNNHIYADKTSKTYKDTYNHLIDAVRYVVYYLLSTGNPDTRF